MLRVFHEVSQSQSLGSNVSFSDDASISLRHTHLHSWPVFFWLLLVSGSCSLQLQPVQQGLYKRLHLVLCHSIVDNCAHILIELLYILYNRKVIDSVCKLVIPYDILLLSVIDFLGIFHDTTLSSSNIHGLSLLVDFYCMISLANTCSSLSKSIALSSAHSLLSSCDYNIFHLK